MRWREATVVGAMLAACSGGEAPAATTASLVPEPTAVVPPTTVAPAPSQVTTPPPSEAPTPTPIATLDEDALDDADVTLLDVEEVSLASVTTVLVRHPDPVVSARLATLIEEGSTAFAHEELRARGTAADEEGVGTSCRAIAATPTLVAVECWGRWTPDYRGATTHEDVRFLQFEIENAEVRPITTELAFVDDANFDEELEAAQARAFEDFDSMNDEGVGERGWRVAATGLSADGLHVVWTNQGLIMENDIAYDDIVDRVRADGPVARMLGIGAFANGATPPAERADAAPAAGPWQLAPGLALPEAMWRWAALPAPLRASVRVMPGDVLAYLTIDEGVELAVAQQIASALGGMRLEARQQGAPAFAPTLRQTHAGANLREGASVNSGWVAVLPRGSVVVAGEAGSDPSWVRVAGTSGLEGLVPARALDDATCAPDASNALAAIPEASRGEAARSMVRVRGDAVQGDRLRPAVLFLASDDDHSYASLRALDAASCAVGAELAHWTIEGVATDALLTRTAQTGGETLVLLQLDTSWIALRPGTDAAVWARGGLAAPPEPDDVVAPALRGPSGRGFWPLAIQLRGQPIVPLRWDAATNTLVEDVPE
jgi:hypothetical protein